MGTDRLTENILLEHTPQHVHVAFGYPHQVISSAVLNGGLVQTGHIVNLRVPKHPARPAASLASPEATLSGYCSQSNWCGNVVGMMTAASMDSLRIARERIQEVDLFVLVTSGLSNPRCAGDFAEYREMGSRTTATGTINTIVLTSAVLTPAAMVEAVMIATEAKAAALHHLKVRSPVSNRLATGTGTDAIALASGKGPVRVKYCGKHVIYGEVLARLVMEATSASINWAAADGSTTDH